MKKLKSLLAIISALSMCMVMIPAAYPAVKQNHPEMIVSAKESEEPLNETISWIFDQDTGILTISGNGNMEYQGLAPWDKWDKEIKTIIINEGITNIPGYAFSYCVNLQEVQLPETLQSIEEYAFQACRSLDTIYIPASVKNIDQMAFPDVKGIYVDEKNPVYSDIDGVLFDKQQQILLCYPAGKDGLEYTVPDGVITIQERAFENTSIETLNIPASVENILDHELSIKLTNIYVDKQNLFYCSDNGILFDKQKNVLYRYPVARTDEEYQVPDTVTEISDYAFYYSTLKNVLIPDTVNRIGKFAFSSCKNLTSVQLPDSLSILEDYVFSSSGLTEINIHDGITRINDSAFYSSHITSITIPESVRYIGDEAFARCDFLEEVVFLEAADSQEELVLESGIFAICESLKKVVLPEGLTKIPCAAFMACDNLSEINIPDSIQIIEERGFDYCGFETIDLNHVSVVNSGAFADCQNLVSATGNNVMLIGEEAFSFCQNLLNIHFPNVEEIHERAFLACENLQNIDIPNVRVIGNDAFFGNQLEELVIPANVSFIGNDAFFGHHLEELIIPANVSFIGNQAFWGNNLKSVTILNPDVEMEFWGISEVVYGYEGSTAQAYVEKYGEKYWIEFIPLEGDPVQKLIKGDANGDGSVDILDVISVNKTILGKESMTDAQVKAVDINGNGVPDSTDSLSLLKYIVGLISEL